MFFGTLTIAKDGFSMVFGSPNCWFQWFLMVKDHWSNDGMESNGSIRSNRNSIIQQICCLAIASIELCELEIPFS